MKHASKLDFSFSHREVLLKRSADFLEKDGLSTLKYSVIARSDYKLFTYIKVDLQMTEKERNYTTVKNPKLPP